MIERFSSLYAFSNDQQLVFIDPAVDKQFMEGGITGDKINRLKKAIDNALAPGGSFRVDNI